MCASAASAWLCSPPLIATVRAPAPAVRKKPRRVKSLARSDDQDSGADRSHIGILLADSFCGESNARAMLDRAGGTRHMAPIQSLLCTFAAFLGRNWRVEQPTAAARGRAVRGGFPGRRGLIPARV